MKFVGVDDVAHTKRHQLLRTRAQAYDPSWVVFILTTAIFMGLAFGMSLWLVLA